MNIPIIRLEVEGMKHTVQHAIMQHSAQMDADLIKAVDQFCEPENIGAVIRGAAKVAMEAAIKEEIRVFFSYGDGRKAVAEAVKTSLLAGESYTPLDHVGASRDKAIAKAVQRAARDAYHHMSMMGGDLDAAISHLDLASIIDGVQP